MNTNTNMLPQNTQRVGCTESVLQFLSRKFDHASHVHWRHRCRFWRLILALFAMESFIFQQHAAADAGSTTVTIANNSECDQSILYKLIYEAPVGKCQIFDLCHLFNDYWCYPVAINSGETWTNSFANDLSGYVCNSPINGEHLFLKTIIWEDSEGTQFATPIANYGTNFGFTVSCWGANWPLAPSINDEDDGPETPPQCPDCDPCQDNGGCDGCGDDSGNSTPPSDDTGMPRWSVSEPYISLWLKDQPFGYQPALGPRVSLKLDYKPRISFTGTYTNIFSIGRQWNFSWLSYISFDGNSNYTVHFPGGRERTFSGTNDYLTNTRLTGDGTNGFTLSYPDGSKDVYGCLVTNSAGAFWRAFVSQRWDAQSRKLRFYYTNWWYDPNQYVPGIQLQTVVDGDGLTNTISYVTNSPYSSNLIAGVTDPFGRSVSFQYDNGGHLTNITDVAGISTSFKYGSYDWVSSMTTPYGTTTFNLADTPDSYPGTSYTNTAPNGRWALVTEPDGSRQLFLYTNNAPGIASSYDTSLVPNTSPFSNTFDNSDLNLRNSFHWGRLQYANLSTTNIGAFTANDYRKARMKHWLTTATATVGQTLSMQRAPSPDSGGTIEGQKTWYDYAGKTNTEFEGTQVLPLFVGRVMPDGTTSFTRTDRNSFGYSTTSVSTYSFAGSVLLRTNLYAYDPNAIDRLSVTNALGVQSSTNVFNGYHKVVTNYDALNQMTTYTYNTNQQVTSVTGPTGLITTNIYDTNWHLAMTYDYAFVTGSPVYFRTNSYTYANDLVYTHTDERGLTTTNTWDALQRLRRVDYPDGTFITNSYTNLDLVCVVDRMGFTNSYGYDNMGRQTAQTNALGAYTIYNYCTCGSLDSIRDAAGNYTFYFYDNLARMTNVIYPDNYSVTNTYNLLNQLIQTTDSAGASTTNWFNNQGLLVAINNSMGQVQAVSYDLLDRVTNNVDANGVSTGSTYDNLSRVIARSYPDGGVEKFGYSPQGLVAYTNQLNQPTTYGYDALGRKTAETNANLEVTQFTYNGAGDLLTLTDGNTQTTTWNYDSYGRATNKVDASSNVIFVYQYDPDNRLTNRWSVAKGTTLYRYDAVGNLTNVVYPFNTSISMAYDLLNRLTNMVDAVGTSIYSYNPIGQILSEDGPWASDTVSYTYTNRLRATLNLAQPSGSAWTNAYVYDAAKRLTNITSQAGVFGYAYDAVRQMQVGKLSLPGSAFITNTYDSVARLLTTKLKGTGNAILNSHQYTYNLGSQRTQQVFTVGNYINYTYDNIGQLKTAQGKESGGTMNRLQERLGYAYDAAGNLNYRTNNALIQAFLVNNLNELTNVTRSGSLTVAGGTMGPATSVAVNGSNALLYADGSFAQSNVSLTNGNNSFTAIARDNWNRSATNTVSTWLPTNAVLQYDQNGNLTSDGLRSFAYDDENQLISVWVTNVWRSDFAYDGKMRRRIRKEYAWQGINWTQTNEVHYVYDGNVVVQERDTNSAPQVSYTRGMDLSGSFQGAGGIGGLLARTDANGAAFYHADGNGNVTCLINATNMLVARYDYDAFGNVLSMSGPLASLNLYRFSSKEQHENSGLVYYLYRFYDPVLQRWPNRDPMQEKKSGPNLYMFVSNGPLNGVDTYGLEQLSKILAHYRELDAQLVGPCCCDDTNGTSHDMTVSYSASGNTASGNVTITLGTCASLRQIYWWDCWSAQAEFAANGSPGKDWTDWGWSAGGTSYSKQAQPNWVNRYYDPHDASHLMMNVYVFYFVCDHGVPSYRHMSDMNQFTWDYSAGHWIAPK